MLDVLTSRAVAFLAADIPLRNLFGVGVVVHGMATVTSRPRGPLHVRVWPSGPWGCWRQKILCRLQPFGMRSQSLAISLEIILIHHHRAGVHGSWRRRG